MECRTRANGYHVNQKEKLKDFIDNKNLFISKDKFWLGTGMYFWTNLGDANYWLRNKVSEKETKEVSMVSALLCTDNMLDLTDTDIVSSLNKIWLTHCEKTGEKKHQPNGIKLNKIFSIIEQLNKNIDILKGHGYYKYDEHVFLDYHNPKKAPALTANVRTIYCVKKKHAIIEKEVKHFINATSHGKGKTTESTGGIY